MSRMYFGYGSNMDSEQMAQRCPGAEIAGTGVLKDYGFLINQRGYATLRLEGGVETPGLLWRISPDHERSLDRYEGWGAGLYDKCVRTVTTEEGGTVDALVYIDHRNQTIDAPREGYLERIIAAAETHGLPPEHVRYLKAWPGKQTLKSFNRVVNEVKSGREMSPAIQRHKETCATRLKETRELLILKGLDLLSREEREVDFETFLTGGAHRLVRELALRLDSEEKAGFLSEVADFERFEDHVGSLRQQEDLLERLFADRASSKQELAGQGVIITQDPDRNHAPEDRFIVTRHAHVLAALWRRMFDGDHGLHPRAGRFIEVFGRAAEANPDAEEAGVLVRHVLDGVAAEASAEKERLNKALANRPV